MLGRVYGRSFTEFGTMEWNWNGRSWRAKLFRLGSRESIGGAAREPRTRPDWEARLIEGGVSEGSASSLAAQLESAYAELGRGSAESLVRGAVLAVTAQAEQKQRSGRDLRALREVERLLGAFSGELEKLDEVLEVLAAYAQRMRHKPTRLSGQTLH